MKLKQIISTAAMMLCSAIASYGQTDIAGTTPIYGQRATLFDVLPVDSTSIVFFGNSLTQGCEWHELFGMPNIKNRGITGDTVDGLRNRLENVVSGKPQKIFLLSGVNDVSHDLSADSIATALIDLVKLIHKESPRTRVYVQSLLPINNSFGRYKAIFGKEQVIRDINAQLEPAVKALGDTWINLYDLFVDSEGNLDKQYTNDGLHLLGPAYLIWRDHISHYVTE
jgi:lysophospholipase L1-like esterase